MSILKCEQELSSFLEDKNSNRKKDLICRFHKKLLKVINKKAKFIRKSLVIAAIITFKK